MTSNVATKPSEATPPKEHKQKRPLDVAISVMLWSYAVVVIAPMILILQFLWRGFADSSCSSSAAVAASTGCASAAVAGPAGTSGSPAITTINAAHRRLHRRNIFRSPFLGDICHPSPRWDRHARPA